MASGLNFPDGLAAAGLAGAANAPVLLTDPNTLPGVTQNAMAAVFGSSATKTVHIVGGESAVSAVVAAQVTSLGYTVNRIAGENRYETAADIAAFQATLAPVGITRVAGIPLRTAIVATGENFPDALSGGAPAFRGKHPILLTAFGIAARSDLCCFDVAERSASHPARRRVCRVGCGGHGDRRPRHRHPGRPNRWRQPW